MPEIDNQTTFTSQRPLYEPLSGLAPTPEELKRQRNTKKTILIVTGGFCILIGLILVVARLMPQPQKKTSVSITPTATPVPVEDVSLRGRIMSAQKELEYIGQVEYQLPLPQVDMDIRLEPKPQ